MQDFLSNKTIEKLKYDLVRTGLISFEQLSEAEDKSKEQSLNLAQVLIQQNYIKENDLLTFIEENLHIPSVNLEDYSLDEKCLNFVKVEDAKKYTIIPLFKIEDILTIAMADPLDLFAINNLIKCVQCKVEPVIASEWQILQAIEKYYNIPLSTKSNNTDDFQIILDWREELNTDNPNTVQAEKIINTIIEQAIIESSFEIAFEYTDNGLDVKFRKEGIYINKGTIPLLLSPLFMAKLKTLSNLDPAVINLPQLGKFDYPAGNVNIAVVVSTFPIVTGERVVIKLYKSPSLIDNLKLEDTHNEILKTAVEKPGIIMIIGSEGSGKSFVGYSLLNSLSSQNKNIMTVESIAKYNLQNVNQVELNEKVGFDFTKIMKFIDFQQPDIIYIESISSDSQLSRVIELAGANKLVIIEFSAKKTEEILRIIDVATKNNLLRLLNCLVTVNGLNQISVNESIIT